MPARTEQKLTKPIPAHGPIRRIETLGDAVDALGKDLPKEMHSAPRWIHASELLFAALTSGRAIDREAFEHQFRTSVRFEGW